MNITQENEETRIDKSFLIKLNFELINVSEIESGGDPYHYLYLEFTKGLALIATQNDSGFYNVDIFDTEKTIRFIYKDDLLLFINLIKNHIK